MHGVRLFVKNLYVSWS